MRLLFTSKSAILCLKTYLVEIHLKRFFKKDILIKVLILNFYIICDRNTTKEIIYKFALNLLKIIFIINL